MRKPFVTRSDMSYFYVYMLKCSDGSYYTGHTDNIEARISQHKQGLIKNCYTSTRLPVELVFHQDFGSRDEAFAAERKIKGWSRQKKEALIKKDWQLISLLAKKHFHNNFLGNPHPSIRAAKRRTQDERVEEELLTCQQLDLQLGT